MNPLVSIIIPAYNAEKFIAETLWNVFSQHYPDIQVLLVNDGSTDQTEKVISEFLSDPRLKYIVQKNGGCSAAKNAGLLAATGQFIQFLDADDLLSADKIAEQVEWLQYHPNSITICRTKSFQNNILDPLNPEIDTEFLFSTTGTLDFVLNLYGAQGKNGMIQPNAFLISRALAERIGPYNISISPSPDEDGEYFCRAMLASEDIHFSEKGINYYRKQLNSRHSLSKQITYPYAKGALKSLQLITKHLLVRENSLRVKKVMAKQLAGFIYSYAAFHDLTKEAEEEIHALGFTKIPTAGGENFRKVAKLIGFRNALRFKNLAASLKK